MCVLGVYDNEAFMSQCNSLEVKHSQTLLITPMTFISEEMNKAQERGLCVSHHVASAQILSCSSDKGKDIIK